MKQHHIPAALAIILSGQLAFVVGTSAGSPSNAAAGTWSANGAISLTANNYSVSESGASITLTAVRNGGTQGVVSVSYKTLNETAIAGTEYTSVAGTITWAAGDKANKTITIPILHSKTFTGTKYFAVRLTAGTGTLLGSPTAADVNIVGGTASPVTKSIKGWVSCNETIDESVQLEQAILSAANNAFTLVIDCPVRFHASTATLKSIPVPDGVTLSFQGAGEFLVVGNGPPALTVAHPQLVTFLDWNLTYL